MMVDLIVIAVGVGFWLYLGFRIKQVKQVHKRLDLLEKKQNEADKK